MRTVFGRLAIRHAQILASLVLAACGGAKDATTAPPPPPPPPAVASVEVTPATASVTVGATAQLTAVARSASGAAMSSTITWSSADPARATVSATGLVTRVAAGANVVVTATADGKSGTATVQVNAPAPAPVATVVVTLGSPTLSIGESTQGAALVKDAAGNVLTGRAVTWASSAPGVATVSAAGMVTAVAAGNATITATSGGITGSAPVGVGPKLAEWTVMVFLAADNNLAGAGVMDLDEMEEFGSTDNVNVVVQGEYSQTWLKDFGVTSSQQINRPNWNTFRYTVPKAGAFPAVDGPNAPATDVGNRDMTSPAELRSFIEYAKQTAPARRYLLVLWNHGNGPAGLLADETTRPGHMMSLTDMRQALTGGPAMDIIDFDMCLMGAYETVLALRGVAKTVVFSEEVVPGDGSDYREILRTLNQNPSAATTDMAARLVDGFFQGYANNLRPSITKSAVNIEQSDALVAATNALAADLKTRLPAATNTIATAVGSAQNYSVKYLRDYRNALDSLRRGAGDAALSARIDAVKNELAKPGFMLRSRQRVGNGANTADVSRSAGLTIVWPSGGGSDAMASLGDGSLAAYQAQFPTSAWTTFLATYLSNASTTQSVDLGDRPLQGYVVWNPEDQVDIDLVVFEPTVVPGEWDVYAPFLGTVSANGELTPDSYDSGLSLEGWGAKRFVARGKYYFFAWLFDDPDDVKPSVNFFARFGYTDAFAPLYASGKEPSLSLGNSWLDDEEVSFQSLIADSYSDMRPIATWDLTGAGASAMVASGFATSSRPVAGRASLPALKPFSTDDAQQLTGAAPRITAAQRKTLARMAQEHRARRSMVPAGVRSKMLKDLQGMRVPQ